MNAPRQDKGDRWEQLASQWAKHLVEFKTSRTARDAINQGVALLILKETAPHGTWLNEVKKRGISTTTTRRLMSCAMRFHNAPASFFDAVCIVSKMFELLSLSPEQCDELAQGNAVGCLSLDAIKNMTAMQLRKAVRSLLESDGGCPALPVKPKPISVHVTVDEERMLRLFRQADAKTREALFLVAKLQTIS